jgi:predicted kinase
MERFGTSPRLILLCGLPGSGKTTLAKELESRLHAVRFCPDEWLAALSLDLYDEARRGQTGGDGNLRQATPCGWARLDNRGMS